MEISSTILRANVINPLELLPNIYLFFEYYRQQELGALKFLSVMMPVGRAERLQEHAEEDKGRVPEPPDNRYREWIF